MCMKDWQNPADVLRQIASEPGVSIALQVLATNVLREVALCLPFQFREHLFLNMSILPMLLDYTQMDLT